MYSFSSITPVLMVPQGNLIPNYTNHHQAMQKKKGKEHTSFAETPCEHTGELAETSPGGSLSGTEPALGYLNKVCPSSKFLFWR